MWLGPASPLSPASFLSPVDGTSLAGSAVGSQANAGSAELRGARQSPWNPSNSRS